MHSTDQGALSGCSIHLSYVNRLYAVIANICNVRSLTENERAGPHNDLPNRQDGYPFGQPAGCVRSAGALVFLGTPTNTVGFDHSAITGFSCHGS